jgi:hypothetical protein
MRRSIDPIGAAGINGMAIRNHATDEIRHTHVQSIAHTVRTVLPNYHIMDNSSE